MTIYNITEIYFHIAADGDHEEFDSFIHPSTTDDWFARELPYISNSRDAEDAYDISEETGDEDEERLVTIYRYFTK